MKKLSILAVVLLFAISLLAADTYLISGMTFTSLSAVTSTGAGSVGMCGLGSGAVKQFTWSVATTGSPTGVTTNLEGSIDGGTTWATLDSSTSTTNETRHVVNRPVGQIRCNLATLTGGTVPTVTCKIAGF